MLDDPWVTIPPVLGIIIILFILFPQLRIWEGKRSSIKMTVGENGPYFDTAGRLYDIRRTFNLELENIDPIKPFSNCVVEITSIIPKPGPYKAPWPLCDGISLAAGNHVFVQLATYYEARDPSKFDCAGDSITMATPNERLLLDIGKEYTVAIRATSPETAPCDFQCMIWVDDKGQLRIEED